MHPAIRLTPLSELPCNANAVRLRDALAQKGLSLDDFVTGLAGGAPLHGYRAGRLVMVDRAEWNVLGDIFKQLVQVDGEAV